MTSRAALEAVLSERILVLDGAMGTELLRENLSEADFRGARFAQHTHTLTGNLDLLVLTRPELVTRVHLDYLAAGCDLIQTNTFNGTAVVQADYGLADRAYGLNVAAARLAKAACAQWTARTPAQPRFAVGTIGPTNRTLSLPNGRNGGAFRPVALAALKEAYRAQVLGLIDGGCDLLLVETIFDVQNAAAALTAIEDAQATREVDLPVMVSATISGATGRLLSGETVERFWEEVAPASPFSVGLNCSSGASAMRPHLEALARVARCHISCHPSAGLPGEDGRYPDDPASMAAALVDLAADGFADIVGGCCGTTSAHLRALVDAVQGMRPAGRVSGR